MAMGNIPTSHVKSFVSNEPDAATIKLVLPDNTTKRLSRLLGIPLKTAEAMLYRGVPKSWLSRLAVALLEEMQRQNIDRSAIEYRLAMYAAIDQRGENAAVGSARNSVVEIQTFAEARAARQALGITELPGADVPGRRRLELASSSASLNFAAARGKCKAV